MKKKIKFLAHVSQALGSDTTNSLSFEVQSQRMKKKFTISAHPWALI
jgi:hypothetical protein